MIFHLLSSSPLEVEEKLLKYREWKLTTTLYRRYEIRQYS